MSMVWSRRIAAAALVGLAAVAVAYAQYGGDDESSGASDEAFGRIAAATTEDGEVHSVIVDLIKKTAAALHAENAKTHDELATLRGEVETLREEVRQLAAGRRS